MSKIKTGSPVFRLTFNLPAQKYFFSGEEVSGLRIKIENQVVTFRAAVEPRGPDSVGFVARPRGGYECQIDGDMAEELLSILMKDASISEPFFILNRNKTGWINIQHFVGNGLPPPKFDPHMRLWIPREKSQKMPQHIENDEITAILGPFVSLVRCSKQLVDNYEKERRIGRPPKEIIEARDVVLAFENLINEIKPNTKNINLQDIQTASELLINFLEKSNIETTPQTYENEYHVDNSISQEISTEETIKRNRGRPRKHPLSSEEDIIFSDETNDICNFEKIPESTEILECENKIEETEFIQEKELNKIEDEMNIQAKRRKISSQVFWKRKGNVANRRR